MVEASVFECALPLPHLLSLGPITYASRDYVVLRLVTDDGFVGKAIGYSRYTPLFESLSTLAEQLRGMPADPAMVSSALMKRFSPGWAALVRAVSLIEIALQDIDAAARGLPLQEALGGRPVDRAVPLMAVAGYFQDRRSEGEILDEVRHFIDDGFTIVKYMVQGVDHDDDLRRLRAVKEILPSRVSLAADLHGVFDSAEQLAVLATAWRDLDLAFIEDPVPSFELETVARCARGDLPIASGEDLVAPSLYEFLLDGGVSHLRVDATTIGGFATAWEGIGRAARHGTPVLPHVWPHLHAPMAFSSESVVAIEVIPDYVGAEPLPILLTEPYPIHDGVWRLSAEPGLSVPLDWACVEQSASRQRTLSLTS